jgi:DNA-binding beta-propeller fold protein YncE
MYVVVPRMPGDTCTVTVRVGDSQNPTLGKDSVVAEQKFRYKVAVSVSTVVGDGTKQFRAGNLSYARLRPRYLTVDDDGNIFAAMRDDGYEGLIRINEQENIVEHLGNTTMGNGVTIDRATGVVTLPGDHPPAVFHDAYPAEGWVVRTRYLRLSFTIDGGNAGPGNTKHAMAFCPWDGKVYTRFRSGDIAKIDPDSYRADWVYRTQFGDCLGLAFHPKHPSLLYMTFVDENGTYAHSVCVIDVADPENSFRQLSALNPAGGFRDGKLENAEFRNPCQIYFDDDGNCYIADRDNHCIRRITPENMVETVVGIPGKADFKDGNADEALFNQPWGIGVARDGTVYVADWGNARIRKLTIE